MISDRQEKNHEHRYSEIFSRLSLEARIFAMGIWMSNIALHFKIGSDGRKYTEHFLLEAAEKVTNRIKVNRR